MSFLHDHIVEMPGIDIHSHLRGEHTQARDLGEVFFYHVAAQAMVAAGMPPDLARGERPAEERIREALPYLGRIRNTTMFWVIKQALRRLHGFDAEDLSWENWEALCRRFRETAEDPTWARTVLVEKARLDLSLTGTPHGRQGIAEDQRDILDYTCEEPITSADLIGLLERRAAEPIATTAALTEAVEAHLEKRIAAGAGSFTYWPARGFACPPEEAPDVDGVLAKRKLKEALTAEEVRALDAAVTNRSLALLNERELPFIMCVGITFGGQRRTLLRYDPQEAGDILRMAVRYPRIRFFLMLGNVAQSQELCTVAKQLPNVYMACSWWHGMYPAQAERELEERLEMMPYTRLVAIITDAYSAEWSVARSLLSRHVLARVLSRKVDSGEYTEDFALETARAMLRHNAAEVFGG
jgi:glucuronate isomerase